MNRKLKKLFASRTKHLDQRSMMAAAIDLARSITAPMSEAESNRACTLISGAKGSTWYHGGVSGLAAGDILLPPSATNADPRGFGDRWPGRKRHVFITNQHAKAKNYALEIGGNVYLVEPETSLGVDLIELRALEFVSVSRQFKKVGCDQGAGIEHLFSNAFSSYTCDTAKILDVVA